MTTALNEARCPNCGGVLPKGHLEGLCPACLLDAGADTQTAEGAGARFEPPPLDELARLFPQLTIRQLIGAGGMGAVYKARQPALDRFVALKILPPGSAGGINFAERFNREARALARLSHPNIVTVHEFGQVQGLHYFIMEFVDGANLRQLEKAGRLSPREALQIIPQICDALQYAHDEGVVHRDIKPENVLVDRKGRVKIADFGLAKILGIDTEQVRLTAEGQVMGTPHYMAPEQLERPLAVDHRADIYSLGVVFYEMLTGDLPLGKFLPPSRKVSVDIRLDEVVLRSLENDPSRRYQRASEVKSELQTISETPSPGAAPASPAPAAAAKPVVERYIRWAGIPLVVDRDGEREITWNGGVLAVGTALFMVFIGMVLFRLVTGQATSGIPGVPLLVVMLVLAAAFRWARNTPLPEDKEPRRARNGTVITDARRRSVNWGFLAMGGIAMTVFAWGLFLNFTLPAIKRAWGPSRAVQAARTDPATRTMFVDLPGRGRVEVLAVSYPDAAPNQWWRPDGTHITNELWDIENPGTASFSYGKVTSTNRQIIARFSDLPEVASSRSFEFTPPGGCSTGGEVIKGRARLEGATGMLVALVPQTKVLDLRVGLGLQPWRTILTKDARNQSSTSETRPGDPRWDPNFNNISDTTDGAQVTVVMGPEDRRWNRRVVAVDTNGTDYVHASGQGTPREGSTTWTYTFRKLPLSQVREFRVDVQPVHWVEFRKIRLNPMRPLPAPDRVKFGPPVELTLTDFIDFDTGKLVAEEPPGDANRNPFDSLSATVRWMERTGLDASAGNGELQPLGMYFVALENDEWDSLSPAGLTAKLHQQAFWPHTLKPWKNGQLPSTFGFRTREGGTGILQLLAFVPDRPGVTLRYKLIQRPVLPAL